MGDRVRVRLPEASLFRQPPRSTQPSTLCETVQPKGGDTLALGSKGKCGCLQVRLCVAVYERFRKYTWYLKALYKCLGLLFTSLLTLERYKGNLTLSWQHGTQCDDKNEKSPKFEVWGTWTRFWRKVWSFSEISESHIINYYTVERRETARYVQQFWHNKSL